MSSNDDFCRCGQRRMLNPSRGDDVDVEWDCGSYRIGFDTLRSPACAEFYADKLEQQVAALTEQVERARNALVKIIDMNRMHANDQYGDADKAESWACVVVARAALEPSPSQEGA